MKHVMSPAMRTRTGRRTLSPRDRWTVNIKQTRFCLGPGGRVPWYCVLVQGQIFRLLNFHGFKTYCCHFMPTVRGSEKLQAKFKTLRVFSDDLFESSVFRQSSWYDHLLLKKASFINDDTDVKLIDLIDDLITLWPFGSTCTCSSWAFVESESVWLFWLGPWGIHIWWRRKSSRRRELQDRRRCGAMFLSGIIELNWIQRIIIELNWIRLRLRQNK